MASPNETNTTKSTVAHSAVLTQLINSGRQLQHCGSAECGSKPSREIQVSWLRSDAVRRRSRTRVEADYPERRQRGDVAAVVDHVEVVGVRGECANDGHQEYDHERVHRVHHANGRVAAKRPACKLDVKWCK